MSPSDRQKSGFELDVVDLSSLSSKKPDDQKIESPPEQPKEDVPQLKESPEKDIVKTTPQTEKSISPVIWIVIAVMAAGAILLFLLIKKETVPLTRNKSIPSQFNQSVIAFAESIEKMKNALKTLDNISNRINSKQKITTILESREIVEKHFPVLEKSKQAFLFNVNQFRKELESEGNHVLIAVGDFYGNRSDADFSLALQEYLSMQNKYLNYFYNNYEKIHEKQQPQTYTYEKYYLEYTRSIERYDQATDLLNKSIHPIIQQYPDAKNLFLRREGAAIFKLE
jgi:hypothetical protein